MSLFVCATSKMKQLTPAASHLHRGWGMLELLRKACQMISLKRKCWKIDEGALLAKFSYGLFLRCHVF